MKATSDEKIVRADVTRLLKLRGLRFFLSLTLAQVAAGLVGWWLSPVPTPENVLLWPLLAFFATGYFCYGQFSFWARPLGIEGAYLRWRLKRRYPPDGAERRMVLNLLRERDIELFMAVLLEGERVGGITPAVPAAVAKTIPEAKPPAVPPFETAPTLIPLQPETRKGDE